MKKINILALCIIALGIISFFTFSTSTKYEKTTESFKTDKLEPNTTTGKLEIDNVDKTGKKNSYSYAVQISSLSGAIKYTVNGVENYKVFNARGEATFSVNSNDKLVILDIPVGASYTVTQSTTADVSTSANNQNTKTTSGTTKSSEIITFTNSSNSVVSKNPNTEDNVWIYGIFLVSLGVLILALTKVKTKKYTTE